MSEFNGLIVDTPEPLTLATRRLFNYLLRHSLKVSKEQSHVEITFKALAGVFGVQAPTVDQLEVATTLLMRTMVRVCKGNEVFAFPMLGEVAMNESRSLLVYSFSEQSKEIYHHPILLEQCLIQAHFTHKYSRLLYELLSNQYYHYNSESYSLEIQSLRDCFGVGEGKLTNFSDFSRFALAPAIHELSEYSSFSVVMEPIKQGRKISHVQFHFSTKRCIRKIKDPMSVIPPKRPRLHYDKEQKALYASILNAPIKKRRAFFNEARHNAAKNNVAIDIAYLDAPDTWLEWLSVQVQNSF